VEQFYNPLTGPSRSGTAKLRWKRMWFSYYRFTSIARLRIIYSKKFDLGEELW